MDLEPLIRACAEGFANGGFEAIGAALATATPNLLRHYFSKRNIAMTEDNQSELASFAFADPERLAKQLAEDADKDPSFGEELDVWAQHARVYLEQAGQNTVCSINKSNVASNISGATINISQSIGS